MWFKSLFFILFLFCAIPSAKANFVMDVTATAAYKAVFELRFTEARRLIQEEKSKNPGNGINILLDDYLDYMHLLTTDNKADYSKLKDRKSDRIDALRDNDATSPYYLFAQAEVYIHWGILKAEFGDFTSSALDLNKARKLLADNNEKFKDFLPNQKSLGWVDLLFGTIPSGMKGIAGFFGMKGDITSGHNRLEKFRNEIAGTKYAYYNDELVFILCLAEVELLHTKNNYDHLMGMIDNMDDKSQLRRYLQGYTAFKLGHCDEAIKYFKTMPQSADYATPPSVSYWLGNAKLCRMDSDADDYLLKFIRENKGTSYIKETYLKVAYYYLLKNDQPNYSRYLQAARTQGYAIDEKDKQALKEANDAKPDLELLKARFYFDGGYYNNAFTILKNQPVADLTNIRDRTEYYYRLARTYDRLNNAGEALSNYQKAIATGRATAYYYAANSALLSGVIYEQKHDYKKAADYYNLTLQMKNHEYQNSIDGQAKDGLSRIKAN